MKSKNPTVLMDLASQVFLFLATFRRKARRGVSLSGDAVLEELQRTFRELDHTARHEAGLGEPWQAARQALVYLVDELMCATEWEYRGWWGDNALESSLLNHPQKMRGILFFDELEKAKERFRESEKSDDPQHPFMVDLLTIYYCCLCLGFEGKYLGRPQELSREARHIYDMLPVSRRRQTRHLFAEAYAHTVEVAPRYHTVMRLGAIVAVTVAVIVIFIGLRAVLYSDLLQDLTTASEQVGDFFDSQAPRAG